MATSSLTLKQRSSQQLKEFLVIALYLWMVFGLLVMYKSVILAEYHIDFMYHGFAIINALALAKVMLVAKDLHLDERFNEALASCIAQLIPRRNRFPSYAHDRQPKKRSGRTQDVRRRLQPSLRLPRGRIPSRRVQTLNKYAFSRNDRK